MTMVDSDEEYSASDDSTTANTSNNEQNHDKSNVPIVAKKYHQEDK
jgi:hypothetical protein